MGGTAAHLFGQSLARLLGLGRLHRQCTGLSSGGHGGIKLTGQHSLIQRVDDGADSGQALGFDGGHALGQFQGPAAVAELEVDLAAVAREPALADGARDLDARAVSGFVRLGDRADGRIGLACDGCFDQRPLFGEAEVSGRPRAVEA